MDTTGLPYAKPEPRKRAKGRKDRRETAVKQDVRAEVAARDGFCRAQAIGMGPCIGASQWAHWGPYTRARTRGKPPEERHLSCGSLMLCDGHHDAYDEGRMKIEARTPRECNGPLAFERDGVWYEEAA